MDPFQKVLEWRGLISQSMMSGLLEEFMRKWIDALYVWFTHDGNLGEIVQWYQWWKGTLASYEIDGLASAQYGIQTALNLMNDATRLGEDTKYRLKRPELHFPSAASTKQSKATKVKPKQAPAPEDQISFRSIVEETVAEHDLVFQPTGRSHEATGSPLFRVSKGIDGRGGVTIYLRDDVVWISEGATWKPAGIAEVVARTKSD